MTHDRKKEHRYGSAITATQLRQMKHRLNQCFSDSLCPRTGIAQDYVNVWIEVYMCLQIIDLKEQSKKKAYKDRSLAGAIFRSLKTYGEYWRAKIAHYNYEVSMKGGEQIDPEEIVNLVVDAHPSTAAIDALVSKVRAMAPEADKLKKLPRGSAKLLLDRFLPLFEQLEVLVYVRRGAWCDEEKES